MELPVKNIASKDSVLLLWATSPLLPEALATMDSWGFDYKTIAFCWVKFYKKSNKPFMGLGYYTRANVELVLLGTKKKGATLPRCNKGIRQLVMSRIGDHSAKPNTVRDRIKKLYDDKFSKLELFARTEYSGFICIGNEITGNDIKYDIQLLHEMD